MRIENIAIDEIAFNTPEWDQFIFTYPLHPGKLAASIQATGLQSPITVAANDGGFDLVLGVKRFLACRELGQKEIPALIRRADNAEALLWASLHEKITGTPLNAIEKARVLVRFGRLWQNDFAALREKICPLIGLPPTIDAMETHLFFSRLPDWLQIKLAGEELSPAHLALLASFRQDEINVVAQALFIRCHPSVQEAREMIENLSALCARENLRPRQVLATAELAALLREPALTARERTAKVRHWLHAQRFPRFSAMERAFRDLVVPLEKQAGIVIHPPRGFEDTACQVRLTFNNEQDVEKAAAGLKNSLAEQTWKKIFELLRSGS